MPGLLRPDLLPSHFCQHQPSIKAHRERIPFFNLFFYIKSLWASDVAQWLKKEKKSACQCRRHGFYPWVGKMPWKRKWQPTEISLPGKSHGLRSLVIYSTWGLKKVRHDLTSKQQPYRQNVFSVRSEISQIAIDLIFVKSEILFIFC